MTAHDECHACGGNGATVRGLCERCGGSGKPRRPGRPAHAPEDKVALQRIFTPRQWERVKADAKREGMTAAAYVRARCDV